jgi:hypothetical protein
MVDKEIIPLKTLNRVDENIKMTAQGFGELARITWPGYGEGEPPFPLGTFAN